MRPRQRSRAHSAFVTRQLQRHLFDVHLHHWHRLSGPEGAACRGHVLRAANTPVASRVSRRMQRFQHQTWCASKARTACDTQRYQPQMLCIKKMTDESTSKAHVGTAIVQGLRSKCIALHISGTVFASGATWRLCRVMTQLHSGETLLCRRCFDHTARVQDRQLLHQSADRSELRHMTESASGGTATWRLDLPAMRAHCTIL
jgi:hypothetical protein